MAENGLNAGDVKPRVAVMAVHGVADQKPHETAQTIAGMLLGLRGGNASERIYSDFREFELRIPVERVLQPETPLRKPDYFTFDPRNELFKRGHKDKTGSRIDKTLKEGKSVVAAEQESNPENLEYQIMREQLEYYDPAEADRAHKTNDSVYETAQLSGFRTDDSKSKQCEVHLYEMYWADLSRVSSDMWRVVIDFYQLLAYLAGIGRKTLYFAQAESCDSRWWNWFRRSQLLAECMLTLAIPVVNLCLLSLATIVLPFQLPPERYHLIGIAAGAAVSAILTALLVYCRRKDASANIWPWLLLFPVGVGAGIAAAWKLLISAHKEYLFYSCLAFGLWLVLAGLLLWAMKCYNARRTGALMTGLIAVIVGSVIYLAELWFYGCKANLGPTSGISVLAAASDTALWLCVLLAGCWLAFLLFTMLTSFCGFLLRKSLRADQQPSRDKGALRRAIWTVNLTLIFPGALTLIFNLGIWEALYIALQRFRDHAVAFCHPSWLPFLGSFKAQSTQQVMQQIIAAFESEWFTTFFIAMCIAGLITVWALLPAVISKNPAIVRENGHWKVIDDKSGDDSPKEAECASKWLGEALSKGYRTMRVSGEILRALLFVGFFVVLLLIYRRATGPNDLSKFFPTWVQKWTSIEHILPALGLILLLMLTTSQGFLRFLALGFRSTVDIALDVANWLRSNPLNANPKARITARCVSQLKYLANWRDPRDGGPYKAFVIIAHSQGTVIISEILRFLRVEPHPVITDLGTRAVYLFTMGSPLRQLYSLRFPHQYAWAHHNAARGAGTGPDPKDLGIAQWVNAYRSGDYVGRYLWHPDQGDDPWAFQSYAGNKSHSCHESCIGAGEHTHYWDETAPQIANELDQLIVTACC